jgi:hypothetical protein
MSHDGQSKELNTGTALWAAGVSRWTLLREAARVNQSRALPLNIPAEPFAWLDSIFLARSARLVRYAVQQRIQILVGSRITD